MYVQGNMCMQGNMCRQDNMCLQGRENAAATQAHLNVQAKLVACLLDNASYVIHAELLCELVEDAHLASLRWVVNGQLYAPHLHASRALSEPAKGKRRRKVSQCLYTHGLASLSLLMARQFESPSNPLASGHSPGTHGQGH